jgi:hypothetical protein
MANTMGLAEILDKAGKKRTKPEKVQVLKDNSSPALKDFLTFMCDPRITWLVPATRPPFKKMEKSADLQHVMIQDINKKKLLYFCAGNNVPFNEGIKQVKREQLFLQMLESVDPDDAELLLLAVNKQLPKGISMPVIKEYIPQRANDW